MTSVPRTKITSMHYNSGVSVQKSWLIVFTYHQLHQSLTLCLFLGLIFLPLLDIHINLTFGLIYHTCGLYCTCGFMWSSYWLLHHTCCLWSRWRLLHHTFVNLEQLLVAPSHLLSPLEQLTGLSAMNLKKLYSNICILFFLIFFFLNEDQMINVLVTFWKFVSVGFIQGILLIWQFVQLYFIFSASMIPPEMWICTKE